MGQDEAPAQPQPQTPAPTPAPPKPAEKSSTSKFLDVVLPFALGGASGMTATCFIQPVDMVKVRIQIKSEEVSKLKAQGKPVSSVSPFVVIKEIMASGPLTFYKGYFLLIKVREIFSFHQESTRL